MKRFFPLIAALSSQMLSPSAFAEWRLLCVNAQANSGYSVTFASDGKTAELEKNTHVSSMEATLTCGNTLPSPGPGQAFHTTCVDLRTDVSDRDAYMGDLVLGGTEGALGKLTLQKGRASGRILAVLPCMSERVR